SAGHHAVERQFRLLSPVPGVLERSDLRAGLLASGTLEEHVVGGLAVERRIEVNQVNALVVNAAAQDVEVVAIVEPVHDRAIGAPRRSRSGYQASREQSRFLRAGKHKGKLKHAPPSATLLSGSTRAWLRLRPLHPIARATSDSKASHLSNSSA